MIVDDEQAAIDALMTMIRSRSDLVLAGATTDPLEVETLIQHYRPDMLFVDLHMAGMHGIDLIQRVQGQVQVVCCTAHNHYAAETSALDVACYLLKPVDQQAFDMAVDRVKFREMVNEALTQDGYADALAPGESIGLFLGNGKGWVSIDLLDIEWIRAWDDDAEVFHTGGSQMVALRLGELEKKLPARHFVRIHRSYIVACNRIRQISAKREVILRNVENKALLPIGRTYYQGVLDQIRNTQILLRP